jgi:hypothetical protein
VAPPDRPHWLDLYQHQPIPYWTHKDRFHCLHHLILRRKNRKRGDAAAVHPDVADKTRIMRLFHVDGTTLELKDNRLKAETGADFLRRLAYLFLYAHECHGRTNTPKADLIKMLDAAKILDNSGNARRWLARKKGFNQDEDDNLKLTQPGREAAIKYLNEALNPEIADQWNPDKKTTRKRKAATK